MKGGPEVGLAPEAIVGWCLGAEAVDDVVQCARRCRILENLAGEGVGRSIEQAPC